ncbi:MAG: polysulfide reductase NrfD [Negativicutes bacterium]|nr:polysulfide reductase NrfD [Negativicutes bacterium]
MGKMIKAVLLALFIAGAVAALGKVFIWGESVTNYGSYTPWGLWVAMYILLVGAAAGATWTGICASRSQGGEPNKMTTVSFIVAGACLAFGLAFIGTDLGKPLKGISIFLNPSFSSKLAWASWIYAGFFACLAGYFLTNAKKAFMYLAGITALGFLLAEGMFFGGMVARMLWNTWLTPLSFITSAVAAGSAAVYVVGRMNSREVIEEEGYHIKKVLLYSVIANVVIEVVHLVLGMSGNVEKVALTQGLLSSIPFWGFIVVGVIVPVYSLIKKPDCKCATPAVLAFIGIAAYKYSFIRYGFGVEPLPGLASAFQSPRLSVAYTPSLVEWVIAVGFIAGALWIAGLVTEKLLAVKQA